MKSPRATTATVRAMRGGIALASVLSPALAPQARADVPPYDFNWANISDRNNPGAPGTKPFDLNAGRGSVSYDYRISKLEITTTQWADFLNMALRQGVNLNAYSLRPNFWGATRSGNQYVANEPLRACIGLSWRAGAYYCNWLNNGKQESWASCQSGSYDASTFGDIGTTYTDQLTHSPGAKFWIPTLDEWLKAAHYDPNKEGTGKGGWWTYPYKSESPPIPGAPGVGQTSGGWNPGDFSELTVPLGAYTSYTSAYGLWDVSGGSREWLEEPATLVGGRYMFREADGSYAGENTLGADHIHGTDIAPPISSGFFGFRIAGQIPSPSVVTVTFVGMSGFLSRRRSVP